MKSIIFKRLVGCGICRRSLSNAINNSFQKVLIVHKLSKLEIARLKHPHLTESELKAAFTKRGSDYSSMANSHDINKRFQETVYSGLKNRGVQLKVVNRFTLTDEHIDWCDAVFTLGGDGTFLLSASHIKNRVKPIIGLNSDPCRSEGYLCIPKEYSSNFTAALDKIYSGDFEWMFRSRIRITLIGENIILNAKELHAPAVGLVDGRTDLYDENARLLPVLALNEVFAGEVLTAKVSHFEVKADNCMPGMRVKSSGICVCTGTGSTSWHLSINRFSEEYIRRIIQYYCDANNLQMNDKSVIEVWERFNQSFIFGPSEHKMGYTIRDNIYGAVWPKPKGIIPCNGFAKSLEVTSWCSDAGIMIDGGVSFPFNDGTIAILEILPEDDLRTIRINPSYE